MRQLLILLKKDLRNELRGRELLVSLISLSLLLSVTIALGAQNLFIDRQTLVKLFPLFLWLVVVLAAASSLTRGLDPELEHSALEGLLLSGVKEHVIFYSKFAQNFGALTITLLATIGFLSVLLDQALVGHLTELIAVGLAVVFGLACLSTLLCPMAASSKLRATLLPLILFPLIFPLFLAAFELTSSTLVDASLGFDSVWLMLVIVLDICYFLLGSALYRFVVSD